MPDFDSNQFPAPARFAFVSEGPLTRINTFFGAVPWMMNPAIRTLLPDPTFARVEMLTDDPTGAAGTFRAWMM